MSRLDDLITNTPIPSWRPAAYLVVGVLFAALVWASYAELEEAGKERNRLTARLTQAKLHEIGYRIVERRVAASPGEPPKFTDEERERLTGMEHDIWLRDRLLAGWSWSEETNEDLRLHPDIAPYEHVPKRNQLLDHAIVDGIPRALFAQGYTLEPM